MNDFKVGDQVTYTITRALNRRGSVSFATRTGKLIAIKGGIATVQSRNGRVFSAFVDNFRKEGQKTALTEAFEKTHADQLKP